MTSTTSTVVRYTVLPGREDENAELIRAVFAQLEAERPEGLRYQTHRDGRTFVHVAEGDGDVLRGLRAFRAFREGLEARCEAPPEFTRGELIDRY